MSNPAFMSVCIEGVRRQLRSLHGKMLRLQNREKPLIDNGFYYPKRWLGNLVARLGADYHEVFCRGTWDELQLSGGVLSFDTETAWVAPFEVLHLIERVYPGLRIYFAADGDGWDWYLTNDREGRYFSLKGYKIVPRWLQGTQSRMLRTSYRPSLQVFPWEVQH